MLGANLGLLLYGEVFVMKQMHDKHKDRLPDEPKIAKLPYCWSININDKMVCTENNLH